jgi:hypothetical protein
MENDVDINPKPITPEEVAEYVRRWRTITRCPEGASFTQHLIDLMNKFKV